MPADLQTLLHRAFPDLPPGSISIRPVGGGSINDTFQVSTEVSTKDNARWFCKFNDSTKYPALFETEARGLDILRHTGIFRIPLTLACTTWDERQVLVLEWIQQGSPNTRFWTKTTPQKPTGPISSSITASNPN
jgi:fructosamine-3-kinase